jgi:hypothetical protein
MVNSGSKNSINTASIEFSLLKKLSFVYVIYLVLTVVTIISLTSFVTFFHLQLNHSISEMHGWLGGRLWGIIAISKLLVLLLWAKVVNPNILNLRHWSKIIETRLLIKLIVLSTTLLVLCYLLFSPQKQKLDFDLGMIFFRGISFISALWLDIIFLANTIYTFQGEIKRVSSYITLWLLFISSSFFIIPDFYGMRLVLVFESLLLFHMSFFKKIEPISALYFLIFCFFPMLILYGFDPVNGSEESYFKLTTNIWSLSVVFMCCIIYYFMSFSKQENQK